MSALALLRTEQNVGTFGRFVIPDGSTLYSLELPWKNNAPQVSCIPAGHYDLQRRYSNSHHCEVFEIMAVPDRTDVEIHWGNWIKDTLGCVLVGLGRKNDMITDSKAAFDRFMAAMAGVTRAEIDITWVPGLPALIT
ncbi:MAG TPA: DUF5675 family protein [Gemmatimonadales bacterium]|nr:DUF5675 family protein [Gemmatimonadales bacterium]